MKQNVLLVKGALERTFSSSLFAFPLSVNDIVESSLILKQNIVTLIAQLFDWFERRQSEKFLKGQTKTQIGNQVSDTTSKQELVNDQQEPQQLQQAVVVTNHCQDLARKPPLPSVVNLLVTKYKQQALRQDSPTETTSEFSIDKPRLHNSMHQHISISQTSFEEEQQNGHPAHWKHVPLKRGRWMSKSLDSFQRGLTAGITGVKVSGDVSTDHGGPEPLVTTWRQQHEVLSVPSVGLNETFSCNQQADMEPGDEDHESETGCLVGNDEAVLVKNKMEVFTKDVEVIQQSDMQTMSNIVFDGPRLASPHTNGLHKNDKDIDVDQDCHSEKAPESKELTHLSFPLCTDEHETKQQTKMACTQAETSPKATDGAMQSQMASEQMEYGHLLAESPFPKLHPELLLLRINLDEKRRRIEQEHRELEVQWKEHRRQVAEAAFLEALHRSKSKSSGLSKKSLPLLSGTTDTGHRNKWLDCGEGGVGTKQTGNQTAICGSHCEETVPTKSSLLAGEDRMTTQQGSGSSHISVTAADQPSGRQDRQAKQATANSVLFLEASSQAVPESVGSRPTAQSSTNSSTSTVMQTSDTLLPVQSTQCTSEALDCAKPVGFFIGGWSNEDSKVSLLH